ncbi:MAG TPA: hypothetical protein VLG71_00225, partial [Candidatus Limnocylindria bacterium]|nr:hypothetical protein [Candidatus Limnocylindria bacterium]
MSSKIVIARIASQYNSARLAKHLLCLPAYAIMNRNNGEKMIKRELILGCTVALLVHSSTNAL